MEFNAPGFRRVRVDSAGESSFVIESVAGFVTASTRECGDCLPGLPEAMVARVLAAQGATFTDLLFDRTVVRVARGYRPRDTSAPYKGSKWNRPPAKRAQIGRAHV